MAGDWRAVFWDLGGVVLDLDSVGRARELFVAALAARYDADPTVAIDVWERELGAYFRDREGRAFRPAHEGYHRTAARVAAESVPVDEWLPLLIQAADVAFRPVEGAIEVLKRLDEAGYYQALVSDIDAWEAEFVLTAFGVRACFDDVTTSAEVGRTKPALEVFETALEKAAVPPGRALYVGDRIDHDMRGGKRAGLWTVAYGGSAASNADSDAVDFVLTDVRELLSIVADGPP